MRIEGKHDGMSKAEKEFMTRLIEIAKASKLKACEVRTCLFLLDCQIRREQDEPDWSDKL